ncbi:MAG: AmmeMemoRadiSam system protein B [Methanoregulaceae archaeon]|nr:AmmeMemoRadiSam system protein B [Methanoregulaceae archaeon]
MKIRACAVAGMFYPRDPHHLEQLLEKMFRGKDTDLNAMGVVSPHAGYPYSGEVAASAFGTVPAGFSGTFIVIGPSHRGYQTCVSQIPWETPLGIIDTDTELSSSIDLEADEISHKDEHSLEVQMPFIKYRFPRARILPILMGNQDFKAAEILAGKVLDAIHRVKRDDIRLVASSDFSHYVPVTTARENDCYAIDALSKLNLPEFYRRIATRRISACGYGPIAAVVHICMERGARTGRLIRYATSGDVTGDPDVVGYAAIAVM